MAKDTVRTIGKILADADQLIRRRLEESRLEIPHPVIAVTPDGQVVLRSECEPRRRAVVR
jgi:hypothetical protein